MTLTEKGVTAFIHTTKKGRAMLGFIVAYESVNWKSKTCVDFSKDAKAELPPMSRVRTALRLFRRMLDSSPHHVTRLAGNPTDARRASAYVAMARILGVAYQNVGQYK